MASWPTPLAASPATSSKCGVAPRIARPRQMMASSPPGVERATGKLRHLERARTCSPRHVVAAPPRRAEHVERAVHQPVDDEQLNRRHDRHLQPLRARSPSIWRITLRSLSRGDAALAVALFCR